MSGLSLPYKQVPVKRVDSITAELQTSGFVMASRETQGRNPITKFFAVAAFGTGSTLSPCKARLSCFFFKKKSNL